MTVILDPGPRCGTAEIPSSKSQAHRQLICSALGGNRSEIICRGISDDISATVSCLNAIGAEILHDGTRISVQPISTVPSGKLSLYCGESGSTLRFLLPICGVLGAEADFIMSGRLPERPLAPLDSELQKHGMSLSLRGNVLQCRGKLEAGAFSLPGNVSSQFISGLLFALPLCSAASTVEISGKCESVSYIKMTESALESSGVTYSKAGNIYTIPGNQAYSPSVFTELEADWSSAAFFLCAGAVSPDGITVSGPETMSHQGDAAVLGLLRSFGAEIIVSGKKISVRRGKLRGTDIDASQIPDLVPVLGMLACAAEGVTTIYSAGRLRFKESDRLSATVGLISALGGKAEQQNDALVITGCGTLSGGEAESSGDHRIAMSAAVAACICNSQVKLNGAECVSKSYPGFWKDFGSLDTGGRL